MTDTRRAFIYLRVSNDDEGGNNASSAAQEAACRALCERDGIAVAEVFEELNVSGRKLQRKQFDRMIALATSASRPVHVVVVYALNRFTRRLLTQVTAEHKLTEAGVRLISVTEGMGDDPNSKMMRGFIAVMNEKYANDAATFTCRDRRGNARAGNWNGGVVPFGYTAYVASVDGRKERKKLAVHEGEAVVVRLIIQLACVGLTGQPMGTRAIAKYLNDNGYTLRGRKFHNSNVDGILTREHYTGSYRDRTRDDRGVVPNFADEIVVECPKIIEPDVMARVAAIRAKAAPRVTAPRTTNSPVLLGGLATCGHSGCNAGMVIRSGKGGQYRYYVCNNKATAGADICPGKSIREDALDSIVLDGLLHRVLAPDRLRLLLAEVLDRSDEARQRRGKDLDRVRRERIGAETRLRRLLEIVEEGMMSVRDPIFAAKLAEANASIASLSETERSLAGQLGNASNQITDEAIQRFGEALRANIMAENSAVRRAYVRLLVSSVTVNDNEIVIAGSKAALENAAQKGNPATCGPVPSFDRKWCPEEDSNLHALASAST